MYKRQVFKDPSIRDLVARHASNLSEAKDRNGKPAAGMRIEIPPYLGGTFKMLENHGHSLRRKHGPMLKRHIKFDDMELSMYLDVRLPGENEWVKVTPEFAKGCRRQTDARTCEERKDQLSVSGASVRPSRESAPSSSHSHRPITTPMLPSTTLTRFGGTRQTWGTRQ